MSLLTSQTLTVCARTIRAACVGALLLAASCGDGGSSTRPPRPVLTTLSVSLASDSVELGDRTTATATGFDQNDAPIAIGPVIWSTGSPLIATVRATGEVNAVGPGSTAIIATIGSVRAQAELTVMPPPVDELRMTFASSNLILGTSATFVAVPVASDWGFLHDRVITWTSSDTLIAKVVASVVNGNSIGTVTAVALGTATITATCEGKTKSAAITVKPVPIWSIRITPPAPTLNVGGTQQLTATAFSASDTILPDRPMTWISSDTSRVTVSATGLVTAKATGDASIYATSENVTGVARVGVFSPAPVASIFMSPTTRFVAVGATTTLTALPLDANGYRLVGRPFSWTTSDASIASVTFKDSTATVTGVGRGTATITATAEGQSGTATITVAAPPAVATVSPTPLIPGSIMTITGTDFAPAIAGNTIRIGSATAVVTGASPTQLTATVPCVSSGTTPVIVTVNGLSSPPVDATVAVNTRTLAIGQTIQLMDEASLRCNELAITGGRYLISVFNSSTTPSAMSSIAIGGNSPDPVLGSTDRAPVRQILRTTAPSRTELDTGLGTERMREQTARAHAARLEQERALYARMRGAIRTAPRRTQSQVQALSIPLTVGSRVTINNRGLNASCATISPSTARVVAVNAHSILLEDIASPTAGHVDPELISLGQTFETSQYAVEATFGDINAYDIPGALDNPGRVVMFFTPSENIAASGGGVVLGHVNACDLIPPSVTGAAGSNNTKIFYARVPTTLTGDAYTQDSKAWWRTVMPGTLVHESKHLTSYAEHFARNALSLEESWLEEGTAQMAAEIYSRSVYAGTGWKTNTDYASSLYCDARRGTPACPDGLSLMLNHFNWLYSYYETNEARSFLSPGSVDGTIYGSAWMFSRWLVDQYGGATESTLLRALTQETSATGVANITKQTGQNFSTLLAEWTMTLIADDYPGFNPPAGAKFTFPSWNTRSIWNGFSTDFRTRSFPLDVSGVNFGTFDLTGTLPGAAAQLIEISGPQTRKQLLNLSALPAGTPIRMSILRVQ